MTTAYAFEPALHHTRPDHPESPSRLEILQTRLPSLGAVKLEHIAATREEIALVHSKALIQAVEEVCRRGNAIIDPAPTFVTHSSFQDACRAAGATLECARAVASGEVQNAFAVVRPPGHHAEPDRSMGFCIFNNIALAARDALEHGLERVAIIDFDAHHGNGTQAAFLKDDRVAYLSTHQWGIYPGSGWYEEAPHARGRIVNVPLPARAGDQAYARIATEIVGPFVRSFRPQMILVSAGFDAHWSDPLTTLGLSTLGFHELSSGIVGLADELCEGRVVFVLEGGYDPVNVAHGAAAVFAALMRRSFSEPLDRSGRAEPDISDVIADIKAWHGL